ncbi:hypothetical protein AX16_001228 [Volvariella volvacea WC 439]|nr:hypothetical protein AX16_001228 [Volvariella volvacea WC 439]
MSALVDVAKQTLKQPDSIAADATTGNARTVSGARNIPSATTETPFPPPVTYGPPLPPLFQTRDTGHLLRELRSAAIPHPPSLRTVDEKIAWYIRKSNPFGFVKTLNKAINDREERIRVKKAQRAEARTKVSSEGGTPKSATDSKGKAPITATNALSTAPPSKPLTYLTSPRRPPYKPTFGATLYSAHQWAAAHPDPFYMSVFVGMGINYDDAIRTLGQLTTNAFHAAVKHGLYENASRAIQLSKTHGWVGPTILWGEFIRTFLPQFEPVVKPIKEKVRTTEEILKAQEADVPEEEIDEEERAKEELLKPFFKDGIIQPASERKRELQAFNRPWIAEWWERERYLMDLFRLPWNELVATQVQVPEVELQFRLHRLTGWDTFCGLDISQPGFQNNLEYLLSIPSDEIREDTRRALIAEMFKRGFDLTAYTGPTPEEVWNLRAAAVAKHLRGIRQFSTAPVEMFTTPPSYWTVWTPVHLAVHYDNLELLKYFVEEWNMRPCINMPEWSHAAVTPLLTAIRRCNLPICEYLVANGARLDFVTPIFNATALHYATASTELVMVDWVVRNCKDQEVDIPALAAQRTILGHSPLHAMCFFEWRDSAELRKAHAKFVERGTLFMSSLCIMPKPDLNITWPEEQAIEQLIEIGAGAWEEKDRLGRTVIDYIKGIIRMSPEEDLEELEDLGDLLGITKYFEDIPDILEVDKKKDEEEKKKQEEEEERERIRKEEEDKKMRERIEAEFRQRWREERLYGRKVDQPKINWDTYQLYPDEEFDDEDDLDD